MNEKVYKTIILSALLHDIGKFAQRAEWELNEKDKNDIELFCPKNKNGFPTHQHIVYSSKFVKEILGEGEIENIVLRHHQPSTYYDKIIQLADWLSSGERRNKIVSEGLEFKKEPLISIFSQIEIENQKIEKHFSPLLSLKNSLIEFFPKNNKSDALHSDPNKENSFKFQWNRFYEECKSIKENPFSDFEIVLSKLIFLLEKYTLFVPSSVYKDEPEISLYHHLKSTSAIASCLCQLKLTENEIDKIIEYNDENILSKNHFLLLAGDLTGIQDFIYSVTTENALKGLRGRSFYLQLLSDTIAKSILDKFNLYQINLIFSAAGNFLILLPNIPDALEKINYLYKQINELLFSAHKGKLGLVISVLPISYKDFEKYSFGKSLEKIGEYLTIEKKRKFNNIIEKIFQPYGGEKKACKICGSEIKETNSEICPFCHSFEILSNKIRNAKFITVEKVSSKNKNINTYEGVLENLGYKYFFDKKGKLTYKINDTDFINENFAGYIFESFYSPEKTLEEVAESSFSGFKKWAALRMDIDNLGEIIKNGLKYKTISRISMLSHLLSLFFSIHPKNVIQRFKDKALIIYSGGDDLFIIGSWEILPAIASKIYHDFRKFTCYHPKITLSGGISIAPSPKFPVYETAKESGTAELKAKNFKDKNRLTFLDTPLNWNEEFEELKKVKNKIYYLIYKQNMPRSLLNILYSYHNQIDKMWIFLYKITKFIKNNAKNEIQQNLINNLRDIFITKNELKDKLNVAVKWADLLTRKEVLKNE
jgi:CRISPR-associated protein Csm1